MKKWVALFFTFLCLYSAWGQTSASANTDSIASRFYNQTLLYPQEKIYLQNDKLNYITGDTIWFKVYLLHAISHIPNSPTNYLYTELIDPLKNVITRVKVKKEKECFHGYIPLNKKLSVGNYQIRCYTQYMQNNPEEYFFKRYIQIGNAASLQKPVETICRIEEGNKYLTVKLLYKNNRRPVVPSKVKAYNAFKEELPVALDKDGTFGIQLDEPHKRTEAIVIKYTCGHTVQTQYIQLPPLEKEFDVAFLPEGGNLPALSLSRIAFKAINSLGFGENITGTIINEKGDSLLQFRSQHRGMGFFHLSVKPGEKYYALCQNEKGHLKKFEIPQAFTQTLSLKVDRHGHGVYISLNTPSGYKPPKNLHLIVQCRGNLLYNRPWNNKKEVVKLPEKELPAGVIQVILLTENNLPISERLFFNYNPEHIANLSIETEKQTYTKRQPVHTQLQLNGQNGKPLASFLSVAVTDDNIVKPDTGLTILSSLLLTSELKGYIENPEYYFSQPDRFVRQNLDILMLTQGWTRYNITEVLQGNYKTPHYLPETTQEISGHVHKGINTEKPAENFPVTLFAPQELKSLVTQTDRQGKFCFRNITFPDSTEFIIQANTPKGKSHVKLTIDTTLFPPVGRVIIPQKTAKDPRKEDFAPPFRIEDYMNNGISNYMLEEFTVSATVPQKQEEGKHWASSQFSQKITSEDIKRTHPTSMYNILTQIPGITIDWKAVQFVADPRTKMKETPFPLTLVDGIEYSVESLAGLHPDNIEQIEILKEPYSYVLGPKVLRGADINGKPIGMAILITTKSGSGTMAPRETFNIWPTTPLGYQIKKDFYSPRYETALQKEQSKPDYRTTLYWNPDLRTDESGQAEFTFYTSDATSGGYTMIIEGITPEGKIIRQEKKITLREN